MGNKVALDFDGGNNTSDAGVLLLRKTESKLGIISMLTQCINDTRRPSSITHSINELSSLCFAAQLSIQHAQGNQPGYGHL